MQVFLQITNRYQHHTPQLLAKTTQRTKLNEATIKKLSNIKVAENIIANVLPVNMPGKAKSRCWGIPCNIFCKQLSNANYKNQ